VFIVKNQKKPTEDKPKKRKVKRKNTHSSIKGRLEQHYGTARVANGGQKRHQTENQTVRRKEMGKKKVLLPQIPLGHCAHA
jgi:hypothetical protein